MPITKKRKTEKTKTRKQEDKKTRKQKHIVEHIVCLLFLFFIQYIYICINIYISYTHRQTQIYIGHSDKYIHPFFCDCFFVIFLCA